MDLIDVIHIIKAKHFLDLLFISNILKMTDFVRTTKSLPIYRLRVKNFNNTFISLIWPSVELSVLHEETKAFYKNI